MHVAIYFGQNTLSSVLIVSPLPLILGAQPRCLLILCALLASAFLAAVVLSIITSTLHLSFPPPWLQPRTSKLEEEGRRPYNIKPGTQKKKCASSLRVFDNVCVTTDGPTPPPRQFAYVFTYQSMSV